MSAVVDSLTGTTHRARRCRCRRPLAVHQAFLILLVIVGGLVLLVWGSRAQGQEVGGPGTTSSIAEAKTEIRAQLDAMANTILEITDLVNASSDTQDDTYLREASATYTTADDSFAAANDLNALEALSDRLDEARWQLDAAAAIASGKPVPGGAAEGAALRLLLRPYAPERYRDGANHYPGGFADGSVYAPWMRRSCVAAPSRSRE